MEEQRDRTEIPAETSACAMAWVHEEWCVGKWCIWFSEAGWGHAKGVGGQVMKLQRVEQAEWAPDLGGELQP